MTQAPGRDPLLDEFDRAFEALLSSDEAADFADALDLARRHPQILDDMLAEALASDRPWSRELAVALEILRQTRP